MSREPNKLLGHASDNDGIDEYDNRLPDWWLGLFIVCIIWGVIYAVNYHFVSHDSQAKRYEAEMASALARWPAQEAPSTLSYDDATLAAGEAVFASTCAACHNPDMTGKIGPNLLDTTWIHGSSEAEMLAVVTSGVLDKGMPAWGPVLGPEKVAQVAAFVRSKSIAAGGIPAEGAAAP